jgi:hypothetical protein
MVNINLMSLNINEYMRIFKNSIILVNNIFFDILIIKALNVYIFVVNII